MELEFKPGSLTPKSTIFQPYWSSSRAHRLKERQIQITLETSEKERSCTKEKDIHLPGVAIWEDFYRVDVKADAWWVSSISKWMSWGKAFQIKGTWSIQMRGCVQQLGVTGLHSESWLLLCRAHTSGNWSEMTWLDGSSPRGKDLPF